MQGQKYTDGAFALVFKGDHFLLTNTHIKDGDYWSIPGGVVEPGESPAEGAIREVSEETGIRCEIVELLEVIDAVITKDLRLSFYLAKYVGGDIVIDTTEIEAAEWFCIEDLSGLTFAFENTRSIIDVALGRL